MIDVVDGGVQADVVVEPLGDAVGDVEVADAGVVDAVEILGVAVAWAAAPAPGDAVRALVEEVVVLCR